MGNQRDLAEWQAGKIEKLVTSIADANPGIAVRDHVKKMIADATQEENRKRRQDKRVERRTCAVCPRAEDIMAPRFLVCAGCEKRRYCSESCQEMDWLECGHKRTCAVISDFDCGTPGCPMSERGYCDFCAETFCLDCEGQCDVPVVQCDDCGLYSCGSQKEHSYGPIDGYCPLISECGLCEVSYCERCRDAEVCDDCDTEYCADCRLVVKCNKCDKMVCTKCSNKNESLKSINDLPHMCSGCTVAVLREARAALAERVEASNAAHDALDERVKALEAKTWSFEERQDLAQVIASIPKYGLQSYLQAVATIIIGRQTVKTGDAFIVDYATLPVSVCDRVKEYLFWARKQRRDVNPKLGLPGGLSDGFVIDDGEAVCLLVEKLSSEKESAIEILYEFKFIADDAAHDALADRVEALEAKP